MSLSVHKFGVQSYCFRHFKDNAIVAEKVRAIGLDQVEVCAAHVNFDDLASAPGVIKAYKDQGVSIISIGVQTFTGNPKERTWFEWAALAGAKHISAHFKVDSYQGAIAKVRTWSREFGIRVGIHCHGGYQFGGSPDVIQHLIDLGGPEIGVCIDTAWAMQIGPKQGNPVAWVEKFKGRIYGIHYKDFIFEKNGQHRDVVVGEGNLDLPSFRAALQKNHFDGVELLEYEADIENPVPALKRCVESMQNFKGVSEPATA